MERYRGQLHLKKKGEFIQKKGREGVKRKRKDAGKKGGASEVDEKEAG